MHNAASSRAAKTLQTNVRKTLDALGSSNRTGLTYQAYGTFTRAYWDAKQGIVVEDIKLEDVYKL